MVRLGIVFWFGLVLVPLLFSICCALAINSVGWVFFPIVLLVLFDYCVAWPCWFVCLLFALLLLWI